MRTDDQVKECSRKSFDNEAKTYDSSHDGKFAGIVYDDLAERILQTKPRRLLDLGCGNGNVLMKITGTDNLELYGLDLSREMIREAEKRLKGKAVLAVGDAEALPYADHMFDTVVCNASFHHYPNPEKVLGEVKRVLKDQGVLILGEPTAFKPFLPIFNFLLQWSRSGDYRIYGRKSIEQLLTDCGFRPYGWKLVGRKMLLLNAVSE
jgi:ubiquinone/menaquinone biosynthesis C-methylase UbiE